MGDLLIHHITTPNAKLDIINIRYYDIIWGNKIIHIREHNNMSFHILRET